MIISFTDHPAFCARPEKFLNIEVDTDKVLKSWRASLFSFEWLLPDGRIKALEDLSVDEAEKRRAIEAQMQKGEPIEKPVLGIGMMDNVEIGAGRAAFLTLAACGVPKICVHIPASNESDFQKFRAAV